MKKIHNQNRYPQLMKDLNINCKNCCGLCCAALNFSKLEGFPYDKEAGMACHHLQDDYQCAIYGQLPNHGLKGCMAYDCFGAGQKVSRKEGILQSWQNNDLKKKVFDDFLRVRQYHQILWYLIEASNISISYPYQSEIDDLIQENQRLSLLLEIDALDQKYQFHLQRANSVLKKISKQAEAAFSLEHKTNKRVEYLGRNFKRANLEGRDFSMTLLIAANLQGCRLHGTNFLGADLRDANIKDTDLSESLFLTQIQINAAHGNINTLLPSSLALPHSWLGEDEIADIKSRNDR